MKNENQNYALTLEVFWVHYFGGWIWYTDCYRMIAGARKGHFPFTVTFMIGSRG